MRQRLERLACRDERGGQPLPARAVTQAREQPSGHGCRDRMCAGIGGNEVDVFERVERSLTGIRARQPLRRLDDVSGPDGQQRPARVDFRRPAPGLAERVDGVEPRSRVVPLEVQIRQIEDGRIRSLGLARQREQHRDRLLAPAQRGVDLGEPEPLPVGQRALHGSADPALRAGRISLGQREPRPEDRIVLQETLAKTRQHVAREIGATVSQRGVGKVGQQPRRQSAEVVLRRDLDRGRRPLLRQQQIQQRFEARERQLSGRMQPLEAFERVILPAVGDLEPDQLLEHVGPGGVLFANGSSSRSASFGMALEAHQRGVAHGHLGIAVDRQPPGGPLDRFRGLTRVQEDADEELHRVGRGRLGVVVVKPLQCAGGGGQIRRVRPAGGRGPAGPTVVRDGDESTAAGP